MADFSIDKYLDRKFGETSIPANGYADKISSLQRASEHKLDAFKQHALQQQAALEKTQRESWVGQAGLDLDSTPGALLNNYASVVYRGGRELGYLGSLPASVASELALQGITQEHVNAFNAYQQGAASPEQMQLLMEYLRGPSSPRKRIGANLKHDKRYLQCSF